MIIESLKICKGKEGKNKIYQKEFFKNKCKKKYF